MNTIWWTFFHPRKAVRRYEDIMDVLNDETLRDNRATNALKDIVKLIKEAKVFNTDQYKPIGMEILDIINLKARNYNR